MINLYGKKYARNGSEFTDTLFHGGGTANGFYKVLRAGIYLSDMQGEERVFIRNDGLGPVTVAKHEGKRIYMFSTSTADGAWLDIPESYSDQVEGARNVARLIYGKG